jgi:DNA gyrase subunit A
MGRNTQGVKVINLKGKDEIAAIAKVEMDKEVEEEFEDEEENTTTDGTNNIISENLSTDNTSTEADELTTNEEE